VVSDTRMWMLMLDGAAHRRLRGLVNPVFSARAIQEMRPRIERILHGVLDETGAGEGVDLISSLALPLPVTVICGPVGLPVEDRDQCRQWTGAIGHVVDPALDEATQQASEDEITANVLLLFNAGHGKIMLLLGAANRDPQRYRDSDRLDPSRQDIKPLAFGGGPHYCIGAMLGRMEGRLIFTERLRRHRSMSLSGGDFRRRRHVNFRNFRGLSGLRFVPDRSPGCSRSCAPALRRARTPLTKEEMPCPTPMSLAARTRRSRCERPCRAAC